MSRTINNVPKLRFKEFSEEWQQGSLKQCGISIIDGDRGKEYPKSDDFFVNGYCLFLSAKNVTKNGFNFTNEKSFISHEKDLLMRKGKLKRNDIILTTRGTIGNIAYYNSNVPYQNIRINSGMLILRCNQSTVLADFFYIYLKSTMVTSQINKLVFGSAQPQLTVKDISNLSINVPIKVEQQKIADFLSTVDKKIQQLKQKQQLLQQYKKGMMQKLFSQQIRFKDENGLDYPEWDERELGDILYYEQPTKYIVNNTDYDDSYDIPVLTAGKSFILGYTSEKEGIFNSNLPVIIFDDFTTDNKYVNFPFKVKSSAMKILYNDKFHSNIKFIYESINMINFSKGDEHKRYWISEYQYISIGFPSLPEQQKIADFLSSIDKKIDAVNEQISQMAQFKQGLLQQLFV